MIVIFLANFIIFVKSYPLIPGFVGNEWEVDGEVKIGVLYSVHSDHSSGNEALSCQGKVSPSGVLAAELAELRIKNINKDPNFLPNVTLGLLYLDTCGGVNGAVARLNHFMSDKCPTRTTEKKVVGIVGPFSSAQSIPAAALASQFKIPLLATFATSDELSDKARFEYFSRLAPPDSFITQAMVSVMVRFKWSYIQLLYSEGSYGEIAAKSIEKIARANGICIGNSVRLSSDYSENYITIAEKILENRNAKVVVLIMSHKFREDLFTALYQVGSKKSDFIFFSADSYRRFPGFEQIQHGTLHFFYKVGRDTSFEDLIKTKQRSESDHAWIKSLWEEAGKCNFSTTCSKYKSLGDINSLTSRDFKFSLKVGDGVEVYARALHSLISENCPEAFLNKSLSKVVNHIFWTSFDLV
ncbi:unnamed protein product [Dimorphilus gyrociliatus]|uniref:Receptor ligand binding region domain-containing protein n=1 Tax=Dimorphilus gyrociliatus TaxID=2664684 RepID=A0A7I8V5W6_9ANNE|nr:unnamed protein product [Dimorphilus gyrociliatus]